MPELPEVETIRRQLAACVVGRKFSDVIVSDDKPLRCTSPEEFRKQLIGQSIKEVAALIIYLSHEFNRMYEDVTCLIVLSAVPR